MDLTAYLANEIEGLTLRELRMFFCDAKYLIPLCDCPERST